MLHIAGAGQYLQADKGGQRTLQLAGKAHNGQHGALYPLAGFPLHIVNRLRFHFFLHQVLKLQRESNHGRKDNDHQSGKQGHGLTGTLVHNAIIGAQGKQTVEHNTHHAAHLVKLLRVRLAAQPLNNNGYKDTCQKRAGCLGNVQKSVILGVKQRIIGKVEGRLLGHLDDHKENIAQKEHQQRPVGCQQVQAFF